MKLFSFIKNLRKQTKIQKKKLEENISVFLMHLL